jgi:fermentation-respiration switch protein FrsA (DUF1100 family)
MELYVQNVLSYVDNPADRAVLEQRFTDTKGVNLLKHDRLTPLGELAYALLTTTDPRAVDALIPQIPQDNQATLMSLSPSTGIDRLRAKIFIMHDFSDPFVPVTESYRLADALPNPGRKVYAQFELFEHVRPKHALDRATLVFEGVRLIKYLSQLFAEITPVTG